MQPGMRVYLAGLQEKVNGYLAPPPSPLIDLWFCGILYIINLIFYWLIKEMAEKDKKHTEQGSL